MFQRSQLKYNFFLMRLISLCCMVPIDFDTKKGKIVNFSGKSKKSRWRRVLNHCWVSYSATRSLLTIFITIRTLVAIDESSDPSKFTALPMLGMFAILGPIIDLCAYLLFRRRPELQIKLYNDFFTRRNGQDQEVGQGSGRQINIRQLILTYMPFMVISPTLIFPMMVIVLPNFPLALMLLVREVGIDRLFDYKGLLLVKSGCFILDTLYSAYITVICYYSIFNTLAFYISMVEEADEELRKLDKLESMNALDLAGIRQLQRHSLNLLILKCRMSFFDISFSPIVFTSKLSCLTCGVLGGFGFIWLFTSSPLISLVYSVSYISSAVCFITLFGKAYEIPDKTDTIKSQILAHSRKIQFGPLRHYFKLTCKRIPLLCMKSGNFQQLERESTLMFMDFMGQEISGLLVSYG